MGLDMSKGIPQGRPSKKIPAPFRRPSISINRDAPRREWRWVSPAELTVGDTITGRGVVLEVQPHTVPEEGIWEYWVVAGEHQPITYPGTEQVWAFVFAKESGGTDGQ